MMKTAALAYLAQNWYRNVGFAEVIFAVHVMSGLGQVRN